MELLLLILLVAIVWLMLLPSRLAGTLKRHRVAGAGVLTALALGGFLLLQLNRPPEPVADYAQGDAAVRAMLE